MHLPVLADQFLELILHDDVPLLDLTTYSLAIGDAPGRITFSARHRMVLACVEEAARLLERSGA